MTDSPEELPINDDGSGATPNVSLSEAEHHEVIPFHGSLGQHVQTNNSNNHDSSSSNHKHHEQEDAAASSSFETLSSSSSATSPSIKSFKRKKSDQHINDLENAQTEDIRDDADRQTRRDGSSNQTNPSHRLQVSLASIPSFSPEVSNLHDYRSLTGTVVFVGSNQNSSIVTMGTAEGSFYLFSTESLKCLHSQSDCGGPVVIIETLLCSSLVALVTASPLSDKDVVAVGETDNRTTTIPMGRRPDSHSSLHDPNRRDSDPPLDTHGATPPRMEDAMDSSNPSISNKDNKGFVSSVSNGSRPLLGCKNHHQDQSISWGCRDVQLWNIQTASRIAIICFPSRGWSSSIIPKVVFDSNEFASSQAQHVPDRLFEPIVAVKISHRRLVIFLDCPSAEIQIFDLKSLRLIHRLERTVVTVPNTLLPSSTVSSLGQQLRVGFFHKKTFFGATPSSSLASVGCLTIHPYVGYLAVPISVPAVDINTSHHQTRSPRCFLPGGSHHHHRRHPSFSVADEALVSGVSARGAFRHDSSLGCIGLIDVFGEVSLTTSTVGHQHPISFIACNGAATMVVTASVKGTIFRVWSIPSLDQLYCWRRGTRPSRVLALAFTWDSHYVMSVCRARAQSPHPLPRTSAIPRRTLRKAQLQDDISSFHVFSCTRGLTTAQRHRHLPPTLDSDPTIEQHDDYRVTRSMDASTPSTPWVPSISRSTMHSSHATAVTRSYPHSMRVDLDCPRRRTDSEVDPRQQVDSYHTCPPSQSQPISSSTVSSWSNATASSSWSTVKTWAFSMRGTARHQLQSMISDLLGPRLPESLRESLIDAKTCFAQGRILHPPIMRGVDSPMISVPILLETMGEPSLEIRIFSQSGCMYAYVCDDKTNGGECRLVSEVALLLQSHPSNTL